MNDTRRKQEIADAPDWVYDAATAICELDGIRPHIEIDGGPGVMVGHIARIIAREHRDGQLQPMPLADILDAYKSTLADMAKIPYWVLEGGKRNTFYVKTCWFTRKCSGSKPTVGTTKDKSKALRFDTLEAAESIAQKINRFQRPDDPWRIIERTKP